MRFREFNFIALAVVSSFACTGCATVDLNEMNLPMAEASSQKDFNVIERAVAKLKSAFSSKGFVAKTSRKRVKSAAKILLTGLEEKQVTSTGDAGYSDTPKPVSVVLADMNFAKQHIVQTTKAAEIYLEMAPKDRKLDKDLVRLEAALMASLEASNVFEVSLEGQMVERMTDFDIAVANLRKVTDEFGARVRQQQVEKHLTDSAS